MKRYLLLFLLLAVAVVCSAGVVDNLWKDNGDGSISPQSSRSVTIGTAIPYNTETTVESTTCLDSGGSDFECHRITLEYDGTSTIRRLYLWNEGTSALAVVETLYTGVAP